MVINTKPTSDQRIETQPADCPVLNVTPMPQPFLDSSGITMEESEVVDDYQETLFSRHNRVAIHMTHINCDSIHKPNTTSSQTKSQHGDNRWLPYPWSYVLSLAADNGRVGFL